MAWPFQSSPALTGGCYPSKRLWAEHGRGFNPHPPLRADAIFESWDKSETGMCFNPHPPLRADAIVWGGAARDGKTVSILTRPYGRML